MNRRAYDQYVRQLKDERLPEDLVFVAIDMNGLKEANDLHGHEVGDKLIVGTAECMRGSFGKAGNLYRMGGDEFVALIQPSEESVEDLIGDYDKRMQRWSDANGIELSTALGYVCYANYPNESITRLCRLAERNMYKDKARYYEANGKDRRQKAVAEFAD